jgi:hypothetical protein
MTTLYVLTKGQWDTDRIEWLYLDRDEAYGFAQDYNGITPMEPVQVEEWQTDDPAEPTTARSGRRECRSASVAASCAILATASSSPNFDIRQTWLTGDSCRKSRWRIANSPGTQG